MAEYQGVMIYGEVTEEKLTAITTELLGHGRKLADDLGQELYAGTAIARRACPLSIWLCSSHRQKNPVHPVDPVRKYPCPLVSP